jgi:hypothetical protein
VSPAFIRFMDSQGGSCGAGARQRLASRRQPVRLTKGQVSGYESPGHLHLLYRSRRDGATGLFLVLFCYSAVSGDALRYNSRFDGFNSRLSRRKFPFPPLRELAGKSLDYFTVLEAKTTVIGENRENTRFHGNNREFCHYRLRLKRIVTETSMRGWVTPAGKGGRVAPRIISSSDWSRSGWPELVVTA